MRAVVVDTSALVRLYVPDGPVPDGLDEAIEQAWRADAVLFVPELALAEAAQVLLKKVRSNLITSEECDEILAAILDLPLEVIGHRDIISSALAAARHHKLTIYDALFLALAKDRRAILISADDALISAWAREAAKS